MQLLVNLMVEMTAVSWAPIWLGNGHILSFHALSLADSVSQTISDTINII